MNASSSAGETVAGKTTRRAVSRSSGGASSLQRQLDMLPLVESSPELGLRALPLTRSGVTELLGEALAIVPGDSARAC